jgi:hypothetical protein
MPLRVTCFALATCLLGCVTQTDKMDSAIYSATLTDQPDNATRDLIRTYVFDTLGPDYIVDVGTLTRTDRLTAQDRGRGSAIGQQVLVPDVVFRLELTETEQGSICRLVPDAQVGDAPVLLFPPDILCRRLPNEI